MEWLQAVGGLYKRMEVIMKVTTTRNGIIAGVVALFAALMLTSDLHAQPGFRGPDGRFMGDGPRGMLLGLRELELTDAQRGAIQDIAEQHQNDGRVMAEQLGAVRASLNEAVMAESSTRAPSAHWRPRSPLSRLMPPSGTRT